MGTEPFFAFESTRRRMYEGRLGPYIDESADAVKAMRTLDLICATAVQPVLLKKLVSELGVSQDKSRSQMQLGDLAERGDCNPSC